MPGFGPPPPPSECVHVNDWAAVSLHHSLQSLGMATEACSNATERQAGGINTELGNPAWQWGDVLIWAQGAITVLRAVLEGVIGLLWACCHCLRSFK